MRNKKLQEYCIEILSLKDLYVRGRINQMIVAQSKVATVYSNNPEIELSEEYIQNAIREFYSFRKKLLAYDPSLFEEALDIILNTEYFDFNDVHFNKSMENFFGNKHTIGFVSAYNDFSEDFNSLIREFLIIEPPAI